MGFTDRYIKITRENEMEVLKVLEKLGCKWGVSGNKEPTKWIPSENHWFEDCDEEIIKIEFDEATDNNILKGHFENFVEGYKEISLDGLKSYILKDNPYCKENIPDGKLNITKPNIIRCLKDLDGFENGAGLKLKYDYDPNSGYYECLWLYHFSDNTKIELQEKDIKVLKAMGFEFEYKPLRTVDEVLDEIKT